MSVKYAGIVWRCCLADGTNVKIVSTVEKHDAMTKSAGSIANVTMANIAVSAGRSILCPAMPSDEED